MTTRLYMDQEASFLETGKTIEIVGDDAHYLRNVLRCRVGDFIVLFNDVAGAFKAKLVQIDKAFCVAMVEECVTAPFFEPSLHLFFAPLKSDAMAFVFEKATELGVTDFHPLKTDYAQNYGIKMDKVRKQLRAATQQCERLKIPVVHQESTLMDVVKGQMLDALTLCVGVERSTYPHLFDVMCDYRVRENKGALGLLIGPEGGFSEKEKIILEEAFNKQDQNRDYEMVGVRLSAHILRAETAIISGLALLSCGHG